MRPPPPIRPMVLPWTQAPSRCADCAPGKTPCAHQPVAFDHAPGDGQQQREMDVGGRLGHDRRDHRDRDAPRRRRRHVDVGWRDLHRGDRAQARAGRDDVAIHPVVEQAEQDVELRDFLEQLALGDDVKRIGIQLDIGDRAQALDCAGGDGLGDEDPGAHDSMSDRCSFIVSRLPQQRVTSTSHGHSVVRRCGRRSPPAPRR